MKTKWVAAISLMALVALPGCGYTVLRDPAAQQSSAAIADTSQAMPDSADTSYAGQFNFPPNHPKLIEPGDWNGRSFLDDIVGEDDPVRFENMRRELVAPATLEHATLTLRITAGGPAVRDVWQIRMDEFGWMTAAHWLQAHTGPELDESLAADRVEFRLDRSSEAALRQMMIELLPAVPAPRETVRPKEIHNVPSELWPYDDPGLAEVEYHVETFGTLGPEDWPGGYLSVPLDLIEILIGTWKGAPDPVLHQEVWFLAQDRPLLLDLAIFIEGVVLAWEVEGNDQQRVGLPLRVGR